VHGDSPESMVEISTMRAERYWLEVRARGLWGPDYTPITLRNERTRVSGFPPPNFSCTLAAATIAKTI